MANSSTLGGSSHCSRAFRHTDSQTHTVSDVRSMVSLDDLAELAHNMPIEC